MVDDSFFPPAYIKHQTMAIFEKGNYRFDRVIDDDPQAGRFLQAWRISVDVNVKNGYIYLETSDLPEYKRIKLTEKGLNKETEHRADASPRSARFDLYFNKYKGHL